MLFRSWAGVICVYLTAVIALGLTMGPKIVAAKAAGTWPDLTSRELAIAAAIASSAAATIGLVCAWYRIGAWRRLAAMTRLDGVPLRLDVSTGAYLRLVATNTLIRVGSLMTLAPYADLRHARLVLSGLRATPPSDEPGRA